MPDTEDKNIASVMQAAWDQTMGEETQELSEEFTHLGGEPPPVQEPAKVAEEANPDTPPVTEEPVTPTQETAAEATPATEPVQAPQHWSESDRATFAKLNPEGQAFLLRRHKEMEADYTRKTQENAEAVRIGSTAMRNIDPAIQAEIRQAGITADKFVENLIGFHRLSTQNPVEFLKQAAAALGVDPAQAFSAPSTKPSVPGERPANDPIATRLQAVESFISGEVQQRQQTLQAGAKQTIEQFASEKDASGQPLRPHFEQVRTVMARLMSVDPDMDLPTAYDVAVFRDPELRGSIVRSVTAQEGVNPSPQPVPLDMEKARKGEQAAMAAKSNIRGSGKPGTPTSATPPKMSLTQALAAAAEEVGMK
jgi:hypothetical protein